MTTGKECANVSSLLPAYANGTLSSARMRLVTDHLAHCAACRKQLREWQLITAAANVAAAGPSPSPDVLGSVRASIDAPHVSRQRSRYTRWNRIAGGHRRRPGRSTIVDITVVGTLLVVVGGALVSRDWWTRIPGDDVTSTSHEVTEPVAAHTSVAGERLFTSVLANEATHPAASLGLGRLTIEPGSSARLQAEDSPVILLVEAGIISGLVDGPADVTQGMERAQEVGQTPVLTTGDQFRLQSGDQIAIPIGTSSELRNNGQEVVQALDIRIQGPGPPLRFANGVRYQLLLQAPAKELPSGQVDFSLVASDLSTGVVHEIEGPGALYLESGTLEIVETSTQLEIENNDDPDDDEPIDRNDPDPDEQILQGDWFFLKEGEHASLTVPDGQATCLELLFGPEDTVERDP